MPWIRVRSLADTCELLRNAYDTVIRLTLAAFAMVRSVTRSRPELADLRFTRGRAQPRMRCTRWGNRRDRRRREKRAVTLRYRNARFVVPAKTPFGLHLSVSTYPVARGCCRKKIPATPVAAL